MAASTCVSAKPQGDETPSKGFSGTGDASGLEGHERALIEGRPSPAEVSRWPESSRKEAGEHQWVQRHSLVVPMWCDFAKLRSGMLEDREGCPEHSKGWLFD
ncbi:hypothetical protein NDU88_010582 [Pleurodeles waltl]|uniref:Uncharacterized protein n=1 Tax=Pleurodeles waltl TaxID=8319 RepID=A0AAV7QYD8_PLEWA|nr:hypothetical protein NDU88_010582 [Pleurodeles waltl]